MPAGLVLVGDVPSVTVTAIGTADNLRQFDVRTLRVTGNFTNVKVGHDEVPIRVDNGDPNVTIDSPSTVGVTVDEFPLGALAPEYFGHAQIEGNGLRATAHVRSHP